MLTNTNAGRIVTVLLLVMLCHITKAQTEINTSFSDRMNHIVQPLEKNRIPNGLLLDYAIKFTNLSNFNGSALTNTNKMLFPVRP